jgi:hypothetical protein
MRTLILSDLHLGGVSRSDLLRRPEMRKPLLQAAEDVDRVVLLGDVIELRHGPPREALAVARPFFEDLGRALAGRELVVVAGNHDHAMIEPWLARRAEHPAPDALGLEQLLAPAEASPMIERFAQWAAPATLTAAYPGVWVRPDVYATHGHYLDCHLTIPTIERLSVGVMSRLLGRPPHSFDKVEDYEAVTAPMYSWRHAMARDARTGSALNGIGTVRAWRALSGGGRDRNRNGSAPGPPRSSLASRLRTRAIVGGFPVAVAALNRAGLGPLRPNVSSGELRGAGLRAMGEVTARLGLDDAYVVFGHTHRTGPLPGDDEAEWSTGAMRLYNSGSWIHARAFVGDRGPAGPYWPGGAVEVTDEGPPAVRRLLGDLAESELRAPARA